MTTPIILFVTCQNSNVFYKHRGDSGADLIKAKRLLNS